ncbi:MAG: NusG domain II-containing protein [Clostridia bacterium]|nr:NusG domain II-containing protein [Clostridia bacterium]
MNFQESKNSKKKLKNDVIFILVLLVAVSALGAIYFLAREDGNTVTITVDGELFAEYPLDEDCTVEIRIGENLNVLVIENGKAYVSEASCPDGICSAHKPIYREGESIICLPNKVVVTVSISGEENAPDIIV